MKIGQDQLYQGAALIQVAEEPLFTAINLYKQKKRRFRNAFRINEDVGIYLKYCSEPTPAHEEYIFTFNSDHLDDLKNMDNNLSKVFLVLVCVKDEQICVISYSQFVQLIEERKKYKGTEEDSYTVIVTLPKGRSFRVHMNYPDKKNTYIKKSFVVARNAFPSNLFDENINSN